MNYDNTYVEIDLDAISANFDAIRAKAGVQVMAIVNADAYGHGAVQIARLLDEKCSVFGVSSIAIQALRNPSYSSPDRKAAGLPCCRTSYPAKS